MWGSPKMSPEHSSIDATLDTKNEQKKSSLWERLTSKTSTKGKILLVASLFSVLPAKVKPQDIDHGQKEKDGTEQMAEQGLQGNGVVNQNMSENEEWTNSDIQTTFFSKNEKGEDEFNWGSVISPLQLNFEKDKSKTVKMHIELPYEYARLFSASKEAKNPINPEDHNKISKYLLDRINEQRATVFVAFDFNKRLYKEKHPDLQEISNLKVTNITATGMTSPEGPEGKGLSTILPTAIDEENIDLGNTRATTTAELTNKALLEMGISNDKLPENGMEINTQEVQFTPQDFADLDKLTGNTVAGHELEAIFNMIVDYNEHKISNPEVTKELDRIIGAKRKVVVEITFEGTKKDVVAIPLPLLLLAGARMAWPTLMRCLNRRRGTDNPNDGDILDADPTPKEDLVAKTELPERGSREYQEMEEQTLIDDIYANLDNQENLRRGFVSYRKLAITAENMIKAPVMSKDGVEITDPAEIEKNREQIEKDREDALTRIILEAWRKNDLEIRKEMHWENNIEDGLNYDEQPKQIAWAKMHARKLIEAATSKKFRGLDFDAAVEIEYNRLADRRFDRSDNGPSKRRLHEEKLASEKTTPPTEKPVGTMY